jgi:2-polyprenyl-6-methoxyphenol hydroxylase-like FAD-dependent oxidoreductase
VRRLVFGPESEYISYLGTYLAVFTTPNFLDLDRWQVFCQAGSVGGGIMSAAGNAEARVYAGFESAEPLDYDVRDLQAQRRILADRMAGAGWEFPRALGYMWDAPDFHFDSMSQIHIDDWSRGRVVLLGDAGYCGSPLSGQGTSMAMVGAYVLAGELRAADGEHRKGFAAYQGELADYVAGNQRLALTNRARIEAETTGTVAEDLPDSGGPGHEDFAEVVNVLTLKEYRDHSAGRS